MDSVTGARMAQALALEGGIGFIPRAMPIAAQAESLAVGNGGRLTVAALRAGAVCAIVAARPLTPVLTVEHNR